MNDKELIEIVDQAVHDNVGREAKFIATNKKCFKYYMGEKFGDEEKHQRST